MPQNPHRNSFNAPRRRLLAGVGAVVAWPAAAQFRIEVAGVGARQIPITIAGFRDQDKAGVAVSDTIKVVADGLVVSTPDRTSLVAVQTPQAFRAAVLREAHETGGDATDDAALVEGLGGVVVVVDGEVPNRKITVPEDLAWARRQIADESKEQS